MRLLITGGTGSLGHALVRYYLTHTDHRLVVFSRDELKQAQMHERFNNPKLDFRLGDVRDLGRLKLAFYGIDAVIHAAALKRVDAVAGDPIEVYKTNVLGTFNVLQAALSEGVPKTVVVSSDKACQPINAYGASKFAAESLAVSFNQYAYPQGCKASVVRYGNVLGSRGSVVHVWKTQDPIRLTHHDMTRFLITMPQAVTFVDAVLESMEGGEVFVPKLPACQLYDLKMALAPEKSVLYTGLRPGGEKLHETLLTEEESMRSRDVGEHILLIEPHLTPWTASPVWLEEPKSPLGERRSDTAPRLTVEQLRDLLKTIPTEGV